MARRPQTNYDLQRARFAQQMSKSELARKASISRKGLHEIETRQVRPRLDTAARIAKALDREILDVFEMDEVIG